jgi:hypothetical protein
MSMRYVSSCRPCVAGSGSHGTSRTWTRCPMRCSRSSGASSDADSEPSHSAPPCPRGGGIAGRTSCIGVHIACITSGDIWSKRIIAAAVGSATTTTGGDDEVDLNVRDGQRQSRARRSDYAHDIQDARSSSRLGPKRQARTGQSGSRDSAACSLIVSPTMLKASTSAARASFAY